jgi:hypothetical protein
VAAADALVHVASAGSVTLTPSLGAPKDAAPTAVQPKPFVVNKGAVDLLVPVRPDPAAGCDCAARCH